MLRLRNKGFQNARNRFTGFLCIEGIHVIEQHFDGCGLTVQMRGFLIKCRWKVLTSGLRGVFTTLQFWVTLHHMPPIGILPLYQLLAVADDLFSTEPTIGRKRDKSNVHMRRFLIHMDNCGDKGFRRLALL